ncbi:MAG: hypothetical protein O7C98_05300 [Planctomycetota bacterium]|nr:hypothetical protein [Planctomycetota bacterium]
MAVTDASTDPAQRHWFQRHRRSTLVPMVAFGVVLVEPRRASPSQDGG